MESYEEKEARLVFLVAETAKQVEDAPKFVAIFEHDEDRSYQNRFVQKMADWTQLHAKVVQDLAEHRASKNH